MIIFLNLQLLFQNLMVNGFYASTGTGIHMKFPAGTGKRGEKIDDTAVRELTEETGAVDYEIRPLCVYSVTGKNEVISNNEETFGMLYYAEIFSFEKELHSEIEKVFLFDKLPLNMTYPDIQPIMIKYAIENYNIESNEI